MTHYTFTRIPIRKSETDGSTVWLTAKTETATYFKLNQLPRPDEYAPGPDGKTPLTRYRSGVISRQGGTRYRIAYAIQPGKRKPSCVGFKLGHGHTRATLIQIARYLDTTGVPWLWLTNEYGNQLGGLIFHSHARI